MPLNVKVKIQGNRESSNPTQ